MDVFTVEVDLSNHDALRRGVTVLSTRTVQVAAVSDTDATLVANQFAATIHDAMPTAARIVGVVM